MGNHRSPICPQTTETGLGLRIPRWVNDFRMGTVYVNNETFPGDQDHARRESLAVGYGMTTGVTNPLYGGFPEIQVKASPCGVVGGTIGRVHAGPEGDFDIVESVSKLHGNHAFKLGFEYHRLPF